MCGPLRQGIEERDAKHHHRCRPRRPLGFEALIALDAAGDVVDGFAFFPDQFHTVDAAIACIEEGQIGNVAISTGAKNKPLAPSRMPSTGRNCSSAIVVMPARPVSTAAKNPHHGCCRRIAVSFHTLSSRLGPTPVSLGVVDLPVHVCVDKHTTALKGPGERRGSTLPGNFSVLRSESI